MNPIGCISLHYSEKVSHVIQTVRSKNHGLIHHNVRTKNHSLKDPDRSLTHTLVSCRALLQIQGIALIRLAIRIKLLRI